MDRAEIERALLDVFDQALIYHAFTDYMRDYEMLFYASADPSTGVPPEHLRYVFRCCVSAGVASTVSPAIWQQSLDDALIDYDAGVARDGFVWGVKWQCMYPGARLLGSSQQASEWSARLNLPFYEVEIETEAHKVTLVFSDLAVSTVGVSYAPFRIAEP